MRLSELLAAVAAVWVGQPLAALANGSSVLPPTSHLVVNLAVRHQTMDNFGANDAWSMEHIGRWSEPNRQRIADLLFSPERGIGLSCWRFYLGAGLNRHNIRDSWRTAESFEVAPGKYDWTRQAGGRWFLQAAKARGVQQFAATVYSPPLRLTRNGWSNLGADKTSTTNLKPGAEVEFAKYLADILCHFRDHPDPAERVDFNYLLPVNEPQWDWFATQEGNRASNDDLKKIYRALKIQLDQAGLKTKILGPESGSLPDMVHRNADARKKWNADYGDYLRVFCGDPAMAACLGGIVTYHSYWSDDPATALVPHRTQLGRAFASYPGWKIWQSEYCIMEPHRDLGMDAALRVARIIHHDLTLVNASAWQWWNAVANEDYKSGLIYTDYKRPGDAETIYESKILWALGNYSRFIRPGMQRVELTGRSSLDGLLASAYHDSAGGRLVIVLVNMAHQPQRAQVDIHPDQSRSVAITFTPYTTSAQENLAPGDPVNPAVGLLVPARSVVTLVSDALPTRHLGLDYKTR